MQRIPVVSLIARDTILEPKKKYLAMASSIELPRTQCFRHSPTGLVLSRDAWGQPLQGAKMQA